LSNYFAQSIRLAGPLDFAPGIAAADVSSLAISVNLGALTPIPVRA
jgi:hypothetical protein